MRNYDEIANQEGGFTENLSARGQDGLQQVLRVLTRRKLWVLWITVFFVLAAVLVTLIMRPIYGATATIELNKNNGGSMELEDLLSSQLGSDSELLDTDLQTEISILEGDSLALTVIERLGLASQPPFLVEGRAARKFAAEKGRPLEDAPLTRVRLLKIFHKHLKVDLIHGTRLIQVTFETHDADQAARIVNASIDAYKSLYLKNHYDATTEASDWLTGQLSELKKNVENSQKKLSDFQKQTGLLSLSLMMPGNSDANAGNGGGLHSVVIEKLDALNAELTAAEANRIEKEAIYQLAKTGNEDIVMGLSSDPLAVQSKSMVLTQNGGLSNLILFRQQRSQLQVNLAQAAEVYGKENRHLKDIETQIDALNKQIREELQEIAKRAEADFELARQTEAAVRKQFDQQQLEASKLNEKTVELAVLTQEAFSSQKLYEDLYTRLQEANVSAGIKATNITVVDPARAVAEPVLPKPVPFIGVGLAAGLFFGIVAAFTVDSFDRTITNPQEVEQITGMQVIGMVPTFENATGHAGYGQRLRSIRGQNAPLVEDVSAARGLWLLNHPESPAAEALRSLRTAILLSRPGGGPKFILLTSCIPGEGKTTITGNLAITLAQNGKKVMLIEADMRRPRVEHVMGVSRKVGLSNVLAGACTVDDATEFGVHVPTLDIILAGPRPPLPSELLQSSAFDNLLKELDAKYDFVLIDSPPALLLTDAVAIAPKVDAVIWIARAGLVTRQFISRAAQLITRHRMPGIGFVLNGISLKGDPYGYSYGYEHYGSYYGKEDGSSRNDE